MNENVVDSGPVEPHSVVMEAATNRLFIEWSDGLTTQYPIEWLRWQCPCALCRGEMGVPGRLDHVKTLSRQETELVDVQPIGRYAVMPFWADGHHDGIFTYQWLRANSQDEALPLSDA
jgi:DUF971 family protein